MTRVSDRPDIGVSATWMAMQESSIPASSDGRDAFALGVMLRVPLGRTEQRAREQHALLQEETVRLRMAAFESTWIASRSEHQERLQGLLGRQQHLKQRLLPVAESMLASAFQSYASGSGTFWISSTRSVLRSICSFNPLITTRLNTTRWTLQRLAGYLETAASVAPSR